MKRLKNFFKDTNEWGEPKHLYEDYEDYEDRRNRRFSYGLFFGIIFISIFALVKYIYELFM
jgi:hypothetical protein